MYHLEIKINKAYVYGIDGLPKTKKSNRHIDCLEFVVEALKVQRKFSENNGHIFLTKNGTRMNPDHYRDVVWKKALEKAGLEYRPPSQTRQSAHLMPFESLKHSTSPGSAGESGVFTRKYRAPTFLAWAGVSTLAIT